MRSTDPATRRRVVVAGAKLAYTAPLVAASTRLVPLSAGAQELVSPNCPPGTSDRRFWANDGLTLKPLAGVAFVIVPTGQTGLTDSQGVALLQCVPNSAPSVKVYGPGCYQDTTYPQPSKPGENFSTGLIPQCPTGQCCPGLDVFDPPACLPNCPPSR
jgi:hypothetical protein